MEAMVVTCMQIAERRARGGTRGPSQMCPQVTFSVWISELIFSRAKSYILSLSLTAANWGKFLKHWHAFEVSLSLSEMIQMSSVNTEPSQQWELFSILLCGFWYAHVMHIFFWQITLIQVSSSIFKKHTCIRTWCKSIQNKAFLQEHEFVSFSAARWLERVGVGRDRVDRGKKKPVGSSWRHTNTHQQSFMLSSYSYQSEAPNHIWFRLRLSQKFKRKYNLGHGLYTSFDAATTLVR